MHTLPGWAWARTHGEKASFSSAHWAAVICQWHFWKGKGTSKTSQKGKSDCDRSECVSVPLKIQTSQESNIYAKVFNEIIFMVTGCLYSIFV